MNRSLSPRLLFAVVGLGVSALSMQGRAAEAAAGDLPAPSHLALSVEPDGRVLITWRDNANTELGYRIMRRPEFPGGEIELPADSTSFEDIPGPGHYEYIVVAFNDLGESEAAVDKVHVQPQPKALKRGAKSEPTAPSLGGLMAPTAPSHLRVRFTSSEVQLSWRDRSNSEEYFEIGREVAVGDGWRSLGNVQVDANTTLFSEPVEPGLYRYRVRAGNAAGTSAFTGWVICQAGAVSTSPPAVPPAPPSGASATDIGSGRVMVSWSDNSTDETGFVIERDPPFLTGAVSVSANTTSFIDQCGNGSFRYRVKAINALGSSSFTSWASCSVTSGTAPTPTITAPASRQHEGPAAGGGGTPPASGNGGGGGGSTGGAGGGSTSGGGSVACVNPGAAGTIGPDGWTILTPCADSRVVYVSSSQGNDAFDGLSESTPKRTIAAGYALLRDGYPDWLLLKSGDVWVGESFQWGKSGRSETEKMVIGSYGSGPRPQIRTPGNGFVGIARSPMGHLAITDLHLMPQSYDGTGPYPPYGINLLDLWSDVLVENCKIERYFVNFCAQQSSHGRPARLSVRRSVIVDAFRVGPEHSQGLFFGSIDGLLLEENVIDHNGWSSTVAGADPTVFRHNVYIHHSCTNVVTRGNISARAANNALSQRPGGICEGNLLICNPTNLAFGSGEPGVTIQVGGVIRDNVVLGARNVNSSTPLGVGLWVTRSRDLEVTGNIIAHNLGGQGGATGNVKGMNFDGSCENLTVSDNVIYRWYEPSVQNPSLAFCVGEGSGIVVKNNDIQQPAGGFMIEFVPANSAGFTFRDNRYYSPDWRFFWGRTFEQWVSFANETGSVRQSITYPDPERTLATYMQHVGGSASVEAFLERAREQRRGHWHTAFTASAVNAYIRAGFGRTASTQSSE